MYNAVLVLRYFTLSRRFPSSAIVTPAGWVVKFNYLYWRATSAGVLLLVRIPLETTRKGLAIKILLYRYLKATYQGTRNSSKGLLGAREGNGMCLNSVKSSSIIRSESWLESSSTTLINWGLPRYMTAAQANQKSYYLAALLHVFDHMLK